MINLNDIQFSENELNSFRDVIFNAIGSENLTDEQVIFYWKLMPEEIKLEVVRWGASDTPTRDSIYVWLQETFNYKIKI